MGRGWERGTAAIQDLGQGSGALGCQDLQSQPPFQMLQIPNFLPFPGIQTPGSHFCVIPNFLPFPRIQTPGSRFCVIPKFLSFSCYSKFSSFPGNPNLSSHFCVIPDFLSFLCYSKFPSVPQESKPQVPIFLLFPFSPFLCYSHFPISVLFPFSLIFFLCYSHVPPPPSHPDFSLSPIRASPAARCSQFPDIQISASYFWGIPNLLPCPDIQNFHLLLPSSRKDQKKSIPSFSPQNSPNPEHPKFLPLSLERGFQKFPKFFIPLFPRALAKFQFSHPAWSCFPKSTRSPQSLGKLPEISRKYWEGCLGWERGERGGIPKIP